MPRRQKSPWFPFTALEIQIGLGLFAFLTTSLAFTGAEQQIIAWAALGFVVLAYLAGLLVHSKKSSFTFLKGGGLQGIGHVPYFRKAKTSLLLLHTDDDSPGEELLGLYRSLLKRGVEIRRILFLRPELAPDAYTWVQAFGKHDGLKHRVVLPEQADVMRFGFVIVDEKCVILSVPGGAAMDAEGYASRFVLKHLLVLDDPDVADAFTEVHSQLWSRATVLDDEELLADSQKLARSLKTAG